MDAWVEFLLNEVEKAKKTGWAKEADAVAQPGAALGRVDDSSTTAQRAGVIEAFMTNFRFPIETRVKGYVVGTSTVRIPRLKVNVAGTSSGARSTSHDRQRSSAPEEWNLPAAGAMEGNRVGRATTPKRAAGVMLECVEVVPEGWSQAAYDLLGGLFVPCERRLEAGSVVRADVSILNPTSYIYRRPGFACEPKKIDVLVAVEV